LAVIFILVGGGGGKGIILAAEAEQVVEFIYESSRHRVRFITTTFQNAMQKHERDSFLAFIPSFNLTQYTNTTNNGKNKELPSFLTLPPTIYY
jgi:hypothetical protein